MSKRNRRRRGKETDRQVMYCEGIEASKSERGKKLFAALMREVHRRGVVPVKGELRNRMRRAVADKLANEVQRYEQGVTSWAREAADHLS